MTASLIVAGYEVYDRTVDTQYQMAGLGWDRGAPLPDQAEVENVILDGEAVTGDRTRNRSIRIPMWVIGANALDLAAKVNTFWQLIDADSFTIQWTPDGGLPVVYDCFRATATPPENIYLRQQYVQAFYFTCQAKPFGRSTDVQTIAAPSSVQIDSYDTAPTGATLSTTNKVEGTGSAVVSGTSVAVSRTFAAKDLSSAAFGTFWHQVTVSTGGQSGVITGLSLTLTSASGSTKYTGSNVGFSTNNPWALVSVPLSGGVVTAGSGVTLTAVTSYSLAWTYSYGKSFGPFGIKTQYIDDLRGSGSAATLIGPTSHAAVLSVPGVLGSARTPTNVTLTNGSTFAACLLHSPPVDQDGQAQILSSLSGASTNQTVTIVAQNSGFRGTYTVMLGVSTVGGGAVTTTVTIAQKENGIIVGTPTVLTKTYTSGAHLAPIAEVTLPLYDTPDENTATSYTVQVQITGADRYTEVMLLDTTGQTIWTDSDLPTAVAALYVDEPSALQSGPPVYGTPTDRTAAYGVLGNCVITGGPILLEPGTNKMLAWVSTSTPTLSATYFPRWLYDRAS